MSSAAQLRLTPINPKRQVFQGKYLAGVSLHPKGGFELMTSLPDKNSSLIG
jgi:hypothetical protein